MCGAGDRKGYSSSLSHVARTAAFFFCIVYRPGCAVTRLSQKTPRITVNGPGAHSFIVETSMAPNGAFARIVTGIRAHVHHKHHLSYEVADTWHTNTKSEINAAEPLIQSAWTHHMPREDTAMNGAAVASFEPGTHHKMVPNVCVDAKTCWCFSVQFATTIFSWRRS